MTSRNVREMKFGRLCQDNVSAIIGETDKRLKLLRRPIKGKKKQIIWVKWQSKRHIWNGNELDQFYLISTIVKYQSIHCLKATGEWGPRGCCPKSWVGVSVEPQTLALLQAVICDLSYVVSDMTFKPSLYPRTAFACVNIWQRRF